MWGCHNYCDQALETDSAIKAGETTRSILEITHGRQLVASRIWLGRLKDDVVLSMVMEITSPSEAWRTLVKMAAETKDAASYEAKKYLEGLKIGLNEKVREYFARLNVALSKLRKYDVLILQR